MSYRYYKVFVSMIMATFLTVAADSSLHKYQKANYVNHI